MLKLLLLLAVLPVTAFTEDSGGTCIQITREARIGTQCSEYTDPESCSAGRCVWAADKVMESAPETTESENSPSPNCNAEIFLKDNGDFSIVSEDYPIQVRGHNAVSGNDDDGLVGFMVFNSLVKEVPHTVTNQEKNLLEAAIRRAKAYWGNNTNLTLTDFTATDAIAHVIENRAQAESTISDLGYDGPQQVDDMIEYLAAVNIMEIIVSKEKLEQGDVNLMQGMLSDRGAKHHYLFQDRNNYQTLCGAPTVRCCNYARDNVLSQSLCGHAAEVESNASAGWTLTDAYKCNVTLVEDSGAPVPQSRSMGAARAN